MRWYQISPDAGFFIEEVEFIGKNLDSDEEKRSHSICFKTRGHLACGAEAAGKLMAFLVNQYGVNQEDWQGSFDANTD